ncbi:MAG: mannose-1-phosphate guanylyltransferase [Treponema sp.]|jgi:mannose-1-phosphate guanylyltransferase/mannose-1-phosphate guanylyltransferase/mannose-6-phosphate isomerase|nr:mannose-1-phosphate guanylyltransferase [Treponema sp.]
MFDDCIIMAGGSGLRLWPASNSTMPKQFLSLTGEGNFFNDAVDRALAVTGSDGRVVIIAGKSHVHHIVRSCEKYGGADKKRLILIPEPLAKNTAPAVACGAFYAGGADREDRNVLVLTSDHSIRPLPVFRADAETASAFSARGSLAVFGIPPRGPETGYGYIEVGEAEAQGAGETGAFRVRSFREKPNRERAEEFLAAGNYYWNSGMFGFSANFILEEFRRNAPEIYGAFAKLAAPGEGACSLQGGIRVLDNWPGLEAAYRETPNISVDYAIAEKCRSVVMVRARFDWFDVGSWDEYARLSADSGAAGPGKGEVYALDAAGCFVDSDLPVALCGADDLIVVIRSGKDGGPATALIAKKGATQGVKNIVEQIRASGRTELL